MPKKIIVVNASPRKGWNTDTLVSEAARGAESVGAEVEKFDLFRLEKFTGCISCFGCKREKFKGHCICRDGLTPVLDAIREADGLIIGSPNYLGELNAAFRSLYERLIFQNLTYNAEHYCCNENPIPVLLVLTSNAPEGYDAKLSGDVQPLRRPDGAADCGRHAAAEGLQQARLGVEHLRPRGQAAAARDRVPAGMQKGVRDGRGTG